ncbi:MAG: hypothetical protein KAX19_05975 [Candidatus Brocadiae bacterium]|nr:hypothetical protein [Candidatus Brocadiia bacterium]
MDDYLSVVAKIEKAILRRGLFAPAMPRATDPAHITQGERLQQLAAIFARGILSLRTR